MGSYSLKGGGQIPKKLVQELRQVEGLVCSLVYGSFARGEEGKSSDIDILNVFEDEGSKESADLSRLTYQREAERVIQFVNFTVEEIDRGKNRALISTAFKEGKLIFLKRPLRFDASTSFREASHSIISYDLSKLEYKEKSKFQYKLYGKEGYDGIVDRYPAKKLGRGVVMISSDGANEIKAVCGELGVDYEETKVWK